MNTIYFISEDGEGYASLDGVQSEGDWANVFSKMAGCGFMRATKEEYKKRVRQVRKLEKLGASVGKLIVDVIPNVAK